MPVEDHSFMKRFLAYYHARFTVWGKILVGISFLGAGASAPGTHLSAYLLPSFIVALLLTAHLFTLIVRPRLTARRVMAAPPAAGSYYVYHVAVKNIGKKPCRNLAVFESLLPFGIYFARKHPQFVNTIDWLEPGEEKQVTLVIYTPWRGIYELGHLLVGTAFPSGLMRKCRRYASPERLSVYPKFLPQIQFQLNPRRLFEPGGIVESSQVGHSNEFLSTREFRAGDRLRDVHWPSTARANKLIVKEYVEENVMRVALILETQWPRGERADDFEGRISLCAGIADALEKRNFVMDLFTSDPKIPPVSVGRSLENIDHLLEVLSCLEGDQEVDLERLFRQIENRLLHFSSLIVFLKDWNEGRAKWVKRLRAIHPHLRVMIVRRKPTTLPPDESVTVITPKQLGGMIR